MATTRAKTTTPTPGKEKKTTSPSIDTTSLQKKTSKPSSSASPASPSPSEKPSPNYLKPTRSSRPEPPTKDGKKPASADTTSKPSLNRRRSFDKPPSPSGGQKAVLSQSPKDKTFRSLSISSRVSSSSSKPTPDRGLKPSPMRAKSPPVVTKSKSMKKEGSGGAKVRAVTSSPEVGDVSKMGSELEDLESSSTNVNQEEAVQVENKQGLLEDSVSENKDHINAVNETEDGDDNNVQPLESAADQAEKPEVKSIEAESTETHHIEEAPEQSTAGDQPEVQAEDKVEEEAATENPDTTNEAAALEDTSGTENKLEKLNSEEEKTMEDGVKGNEGMQRLKLKEREEVGPVEDSKRQEGNGKKESAAYNDVIEETASKLLGKRKNKVLALVAGFETVISLQEPEGSSPN